MEKLLLIMKNISMIMKGIGKKLSYYPWSKSNHKKKIHWQRVNEAKVSELINLLISAGKITHLTLKAVLSKTQPDIAAIKSMKKHFPFYFGSVKEENVDKEIRKLNPWTSVHNTESKCVIFQGFICVCLTNSHEILIAWPAKFLIKFIYNSSTFQEIL